MERGSMSEMAKKFGKVGAAAALTFELMGTAQGAEKGKATSNLDAVEEIAKRDNPNADPSTGAQVVEGPNFVGVRHLEQVKEDGEDVYEDITVSVGDNIEGRIKFVNSLTGEEIPVPEGFDKMAAEWKALVAAQRALDIGGHKDEAKRLEELGKKVAEQMKSGEGSVLAQK
jgi:hypothetical protein